MKLNGVNAISGYMGLSESTVMDKILKSGLPAKFDAETSSYFAESEEIDRFLAGPVREEPKKPEKKARAKKYGGKKKKTAVSAGGE